MRHLSRNICLLLLLFVSPAGAETYWVSPTGTAANLAACSGATPLSGTDACSRTKALAGPLSAGDTVYLRAGDSTGGYVVACSGLDYEGIKSPNDGTSGTPITFSAYNNEEVILTQANFTTAGGYGLYLNGRSYIKITGIQFKNFRTYGNLRNSSYNEISYNQFYTTTDVMQTAGVSGLWMTSSYAPNYNYWNTHNWIHHNKFSRAISAGECEEGGDLIRIGDAPSSQTAPDNADDNNTIENNYFEYTGHTIIDTYGGKGVIRNNVIHNEGWATDLSEGTCTYPPMPNGKYGHRGIQISEDYGRVFQANLVEGNRIGWTSANPNNPGEGSLTIAGSAVIARYNAVYGGHQSGIINKYEGYKDGGTTTLSADVTVGTSGVTVSVADMDDITETSSTYWLKIAPHLEYIYCTGRSDNTFTTCKASNGTSRDYTSGATVYTNKLARRGQGGAGPYRVRIYNNTSFWNGQTYPYMQSAQDGCTTCPGKLSGITMFSNFLDAKVVNNIAYDNYGYTYDDGICATRRDITVGSVGYCKDPADYPTQWTVTNNWETRTGDPKFVNPIKPGDGGWSDDYYSHQNVLSSLTSTYVANPLPDLKLQSDSTAIDGGTSLTTAHGAGNATKTLIVHDAMFFQDGTWGSSLAGHTADWICIGTASNCTQIDKANPINYTTHTITLVDNMTWADDAPIWLYKRSDGTRVLYGAAPDYGANEYEPVGNVRGVTASGVTIQ